MKKEYFEPEIKCVKLAMSETILAFSDGEGTDEPGGDYGSGDVGGEIGGID